jgi:chromosomal replication initiation ATPase DnaA
MAMWLVWQLCGLTLAETGKLFGELDYAAVAQRIRRARAALSENE